MHSWDCLCLTPFWYVERKLKKTGHQEEALPDELRLKMLQSMCAGDRCLAVDESELRRPKGEKSFTFETLERSRNTIRRAGYSLWRAAINCILFRAGTGSENL